jgi:hypothetical protein
MEAACRCICHSSREKRCRMRIEVSGGFDENAGAKCGRLKRLAYPMEKRRGLTRI